MTREFVTTRVFDRRWHELNLTDEDLRNLQNYIMQNPMAGDIIVGTGGLRKLRWALSGKGKSGGIRVLYLDFMLHETVIFINCYSKKEKDTLTDKEKQAYKTIIKEIEKGLI